jgi:DNA-binding LacI/PurR family transcriptional regulator
MAIFESPSKVYAREEIFPLASKRAKSALLQRIGSDWPEGARLPSLSALSHELHLGQGSVQRAVRELVREGWLVSRQRVGTFVAAAAETAKRHRGRPSEPSTLAPRRIRMFVSERDGDPFLMAMAKAFADTMATADSELLRADFQARSPDFRNDADVEAVVVFNPNSIPDIVCRPEHLLVVINTAEFTPVAMQGRFDVVTVDQEHGGFLAGRRLRASGHDDACFVGVHPQTNPHVYDSTSAARLRGFERGWGRQLPESRLIRVGAYTEGRGARAVADYVAMEPRPPVVFAADDGVAIGFVRGALAHGLEPRRDYQIMGFDGQQRARELSEGPLTTVAVPTAEMGRRAAELLIDRFVNPDQPVRRLLLGCQLFEGATVVVARTEA